MAKEYTHERTLRLTKAQHLKVKKAAKLMKAAGKAKSESDVIRHLIDTYIHV